MKFFRWNGIDRDFLLFIVMRRHRPNDFVFRSLFVHSLWPSSRHVRGKTRKQEPLIVNVLARTCTRGSCDARIKSTSHVRSAFDDICLFLPPFKHIAWPFVIALELFASSIDRKGKKRTRNLFYLCHNTKYEFIRRKRWTWWANQASNSSVMNINKGVFRSSSDLAIFLFVFSRRWQLRESRKQQN